MLLICKFANTFSCPVVLVVMYYCILNNLLTILRIASNASHWATTTILWGFLIPRNNTLLIQTNHSCLLNCSALFPSSYPNTQHLEILWKHKQISIIIRRNVMRIHCSDEFLMWCKAGLEQTNDFLITAHQTLHGVQYIAGHNLRCKFHNNDIILLIGWP